ncbi:MAG: hypothetical protein NC177_08270 [Ruminococcus flavefaciens]|nr:hypothetical protein [Ruminococcus flavefaciens]
MGKSKGKGFFSRLKKSTVITMVSCISFVVMTFLALLFFIKFPITPSEKIMASIGRESIYRHNSVEGLEVTTASAVPETQTTTTSAVTTTTALQTTTASTTHSDFVITITTGKGFLTGGRIPTIEYNPDEIVTDYINTPEDTFTTTTVTDEYGYDYGDGEQDYNDYGYGNDYNYDYDYGYGYDDNYGYGWGY